MVARPVVILTHLLEGVCAFVWKQVTEADPHLPSRLISYRLLASTRGWRRIKMRVSCLSFPAFKPDDNSAPERWERGAASASPPRRDSFKSVKL